MVRIPNNYFRVSSADRDPLRIGLLLDSQHAVPAFAATAIEDIQASNFAEIQLLVTRKNIAGTPAASQPPNSRVGRPVRYLSDSTLRKQLLYDLYRCFEERMKPANDPVAKVDCRNLLAGIQTLHVELAEEEKHQFPADALEAIRSKDLDVLIRFGFKTLSGGVLKVARYGVWSYQHGDDEFYRGGPAHFWELRESFPLSGVILKVLNDEPSRGLVLCKSLFTTEKTLSISRNRYAPYWGSSDMVIWKLNELHQFGWDYVLERAEPVTRYKGRQEIYKTPTNRDMLPWLGPILIKKVISYPFRRKMVQHWRIGIRIDGKPLYDSDGDSDLSGFRWIDPPQGHAWADPFVLEHNGKRWAFFEDYSYQEERAGIACSEISAVGEFGPLLPCLSNPGRHYSYPHVFRAGSEIFMIPESFDSNRVDLYRCREFPNHWVHEATLLEGKFADTTIWQHEGLWWLTTTSADPGPGAGPLLLFYSASLTGDWHFHPGNPICTDIRRNRGAGCVLRMNKRLIRPSQNGAPSYGYSIAFNEITELSRQRYSERCLKIVSPQYLEGISGIHTYNSIGNLEVIDGRSPVPLKRVQFLNR
jgi:hypothetical protein